MSTSHHIEHKVEICCYGRDITGRSILRHPAEVSIEMSGRKPGRQIYIKPLACRHLEVSNRGVLLCNASGTRCCAMRLAHGWNVHATSTILHRQRRRMARQMLRMDGRLLLN
ncbi:MAG: hypothetical protein UW10_C0015G0014 [Candidatus Magasanikbacteria bacterium GW2011_GWA2_43_9]|nr:MAG: hypothetical protein UW10_C0015G0014 [Candidatus Magasanikbacteria bacterium GW2011_GWA2_43_9]